MKQPIEKMESTKDRLLRLVMLARSARFRIPAKHEVLHRSYKGAHTSYFMLVFIEGHGMYAMAGGLLFLLSLADFFLHFE